MYGRNALKALLGLPTRAALPLELIPVDRILQRWAVSNGTGLPTDRWDDARSAKPPPLDDEICILVDRIIRTCPPKTRYILGQWYRRPLPTMAIADNLGMSKKSLETAWKLGLNFVRWRFEESGNAALVKLLRIGV